MLLNGKRVNLNQLETELRAASIFLKALVVAGDNLLIVDAQDRQVEPPQSAAVVLANHVPPLLTDYGADAPPRDQVAAAVANIRQYLALSAPTNPQVIAEVRLLSRCVLYLLQQIAV
jgi:hypothetical protein